MFFHPITIFGVCRINSKLRSMSLKTIHYPVQKATLQSSLLYKIFCTMPLSMSLIYFYFFYWLCFSLVCWYLFLFWLSCFNVSQFMKSFVITFPSVLFIVCSLDFCFGGSVIYLFIIPHPLSVSSGHGS
jgi:hypothetical protein